MRLSYGRNAATLLVGIVVILLAFEHGSTARQPPIPNPVLLFTGQEPYETGGKQWIRYKYAVVNLTDYPNDMFAAAPDLPHCEANTKSSRTWVDVYNSSGKKLHQFCALANRDGLNKLWFALEKDAVPPSWVYVEMNDRKTNTKYKSNLAETTE